MSTAKPTKPTRRVRVKIDAIVEYDRNLLLCPISDGEIAKYHREELLKAMLSVYQLRPGAARVGITSLTVELDHRKVK